MKLFFASCATLALTYLLVPFVVALSWKIGAIDVPTDWRRMHCKPIPRAGGLAIFGGLFVGMLYYGLESSYLRYTLGGGFLLLLLGVADDAFCIKAWSKLFFQIAITVTVIFCCGGGVRFSSLLAVLWVLTLTNAHNFIDGLDGLFAGCAAIEGGALCLSFLVMWRWNLMVFSLLLSLSCLAFRAYNRSPAQIFAGDCGSGTVGFLLGMLSLPLLFGGDASFSVLSPFFLFAYPITDLFCAVLRRLLKGSNPFLADRAHLHHRICAMGVGHTRCVGVLLMLCFALSSVGVLLLRPEWLSFAAFSCSVVVLLMMRIRRYLLGFS